jgi:hypothetical protein
MATLENLFSKGGLDNPLRRNLAFTTGC